MLSRNPRSGFTLVELLVVTGILLILAGLSVGVISVALEGDRIPSSARQVQSFLEGARDRAIFAQENRGVRFIRSETRDDEIVSMMYIGSAGESTGKAQVDYVEHPMMPGTFFYVLTQESGQSWTDLYNRELLVKGARIQFGTLWYSIHDDTFDDAANYIELPSAMSGPRIKLSRDWIGPADPDPMDPLVGLDDQAYTLELAPVPLPDEEVVSLPRGVVIDVDESQLPLLWKSDPDVRLEVLFSPHGTVTGSVASAGLLHFLVADTRDTELARVIGAPDKEGEELIVTLFTKTGLIETFPVDVTDLNDGAMGPPDGIADDPFRYAETGASE